MAVTAEPSINELRDLLAGDEPVTNLPEPVEAPAAEAPAAAEAVPAAKPAPAQEPEVVQERDEHGKFVSKEKEPPPAEEVIPPGAQKAIDKEISKAVRARRETERLNARLEEQLKRLEEAKPLATQNTAPEPVPAAPAAKSKPALVVPKIEDYEYDTEKHEAAKAEAIAEYTDKLTDWKIEQRELAQKTATQRESQRTAQQTRAQQIQTRIEEGRAEFPDFDEVVMDKEAPISEAMLDVIVQSPVGTKLAYYLGSHRDELARISQLSPVAQGLELGQIAATFKTPPKAAAPAKATPAPRAPLPKPPVVVGAGGTPADVDLDTADMRTFKKEMNKLLNGR